MAVTPLTASGQHGWDRILAGAARMDPFDDGCWREDDTPLADVAKLNIAEADARVLGQGFTRPGGSILHLGLWPYDIGLRVLRLPDAAAVGYGFTGADADLPAPGWWRLIASRRARLQLCGPQASDEKEPACLRS